MNNFTVSVLETKRKTEIAEKLLCRNSKTDSHLAVRSAIRVPRGFRPELALFSLANGILRRASPLDGNFALSDLCNSFPILPEEAKSWKPGDDVMIVLHPKSF